MRNQIYLRTALFALVFAVITIGVPRVALKPKLETIQAVPISGSTPKACVGYNFNENSWSPEFRQCPKNFAVYNVEDPEGLDVDGNILGLALTCCPLPSSDILTDEHIQTEDTCPENFIATGIKNFVPKLSDVKHLRCTKINTERYQLGEMMSSYYWGNGFAGWQGSYRIDWEQIPSALRYASGRIADNTWSSDGCVGYPWGSLLAKKSSKYCSGLFFRQLQFKGIPGDPARGTAVKMLPDCETVENFNDSQNYFCRHSG